MSVLLNSKTKSNTLISSNKECTSQVSVKNKTNTLLTPGVQDFIEQEHDSILLVEKNPHVCNLEKDNKYLEIKNYLSEFTTEEQKRKVLQNLGIDDLDVSWGNIKGNIEDQEDLKELLQQKDYNTLDLKIKEIYNDLIKKIDKQEALTQIKYTNESYPDIKNLGDALEELLYFDLKLSLTLNNSDNITLETGSSISNINIAWNYNKIIKDQQLYIKTNNYDYNNLEISLTDNSYIYSQPIEENTEFKLIATDSKKSFYISKYIYFVPAIYYGAFENFDLNNDFKNCSKKIQSSRNGTFNVNATDNKYIYICIPVSYGNPTFTVGIVSGGFSKQQSSVKFNNGVIYNIYCSNQPNLGITDVKVT